MAKRKHTTTTRGRYHRPAKGAKRHVEYAFSPEPAREFKPIQATPSKPSALARAWSGLSPAGQALAVTLLVGTPVMFFWGRSSGAA